MAHLQMSHLLRHILTIIELCDVCTILDASHPLVEQRLCAAPRQPMQHEAQRLRQHNYEVDRTLTLPDYLKVRLLDAKRPVLALHQLGHCCFHCIDCARYAFCSELIVSATAQSALVGAVLCPAVAIDLDTYAAATSADICDDALTNLLMPDLDVLRIQLCIEHP
eukprot:1588725-Prymnesium_polylepis.1